MPTSRHGALGALIRRRREDKRLTQLELAQALKLDATPAISRWEKGAAPVPPIHYKLLAAALDLPLKTILSVAPPDDVRRFELSELRASKGLPTRRASHEIGLDSVLLRHPKLLEGFTQLHEQYPDFSLQRLVDNACMYFLACALDSGLNGHGMPTRPPGESHHPRKGRSDQQSGRTVHSKPAKLA